MNRASLNSTNANYMDKSHRGLYVAKGDKPAEVTKKNHKEITFLAKVTQVNGERYTMDVITLDSAQVLTDIYWMPAYQGPMGYMGVMPEVGCLVVLLNGSKGILIPISYFIPDAETALSYNLVERFPESVSDEANEHTRVMPSRIRKMRSGEGRLASAQGAEIFLDDSVEIENRAGNSVRLRAGDGSFITTTQQNYMFTNGVWRSAGPIQRNSLAATVAGDAPGGIEAKEVINSDGTKSVYIGGDFGHGGQVYNEYRLEVEDSNRLNKPVNDVNDGENVTPRSPRVIMSIANYVGNDPNDIENYGKFLAPAFISEGKGDGRLGFEALSPSGDNDDIGKRGVAWSFHIPGKGFYGFDKQGVKYEYMSEARGTNTGVSQVTVARGGKREEWGAIREDNVSWDLFTKGGIRWVIGQTAENPEKNKIPRSMEVRYIGSTYTEHGFDASFNPKIIRYLRGNDKGKVLNKLDLATYRRVERVAGHSRDEVMGNSEHSIGGDEFKKISGLKSTSIGGSMSESSTGDRTISTMGAFSVNATTEIKITSAQRTEKLVKGSDEKQILLGDRTTDIVVGNYKTTVGTGNIERQVGVGDVKDVIATGNHSTTVGAGNYSVSVGAGSMSLSTSGSFSISGTSVNITSTSTSVDSAFVSLGNPATRSGVITMLSHKDYTTGAPLIPSLTVTAGL